MSQPLLIDVITREVGTDNPPTKKTIDYNIKTDRQWLAMHSLWALNHGRSITTAPAETN